MLRSLAALFVSGTLVLAGCGNSSAPATSTTTSANATPIKHIVIIMHENRSFDNLFNGYPGADTVTSGMSFGKSVTLQPIPFEQGTDVDHSHTGWWTDWDSGAMDGFHSHPESFLPIRSSNLPLMPMSPRVRDRALLDSRPALHPRRPHVPVQHRPQLRRPPVHDRGAQSGDTDENPDGQPWGCDAPASERVALIGPNGTDLPGIYPCLDYQTMADVLDAKGITWRYYAPGITTTSNGIAVYGSGFIWSAFQAIRHIRFGPDWTNNVISPNTQVLTDIAAGQLAQVTWITPAGSYF